jgi:CheY-like chemotaxis protein
VKKVIIAQEVLGSIDGAHSLFSRGGIKVLTARTSEELIELHRRMRADLIIADLALPVMGGAALLAKVRGDAELRDVSIIMVHDGREASKAICRNAGANAALGKPVDAADLFGRVSELIIVPQRKDMRVMLRVSIEDGRGGGPVFASSENISISGMLIEVNHPYRPGDLLLCVFHIGHSEVRAEGRVVRFVRAASGRYRCGIHFTNLDTKAMIVIEQYVQSQKGASPEGP